MFEPRARTAPLDDIRVRDCMHHGVLTCTAEDSLRDVAAIMANHRVHTVAQLMNEHGVSHVVVLDGAGGYPVGVLSSLDVAAVYAES